MKKKEKKISTLTKHCKAQKFNIRKVESELSSKLSDTINLLYVHPIAFRRPSEI